MTVPMLTIGCMVIDLVVVVVVTMLLMEGEKAKSVRLNTVVDGEGGKEWGKRWMESTGSDRTQAKVSTLHT